MKKLLLSLLCLVGFISANAITFVMSEQAPFSGGTTISGIEEWTNGDYTFTPAKGETSSTAPAYNKNGDVRLYAANTFTITCATGNMTEVSFTISSQGKKRMTTVTSSTGTMTVTGADDYTCKWTGDAATVTFTVGDKATLGTDGATKAGQLCFTQIDITGAGSGSTVQTVAMPTFSPNGGDIVAGTEVTISCGTEGAAIYYTVDGSAPTNASTPYSSALVINESCTVNAIAVKEGMADSNVASATFTIVEAATYGYVKAVTSGKNYVIYANDKIATPLTGNYGYVPATAATDENGYISTDKTNAFTITAVDGGYTIQDAEGYYYFGKFKSDGTTPYYSLNRDTTMPENGAVWTIEPQTDGTMKILNTYVNCYLQFDPTYGNFGSYPDARGTMPFLYEEGATAQSKPEAPIEEVATIAEWLAKASTAKVKITGTVTVMYQNGRYLYVKDDTSALLVYGDLTNKYSNGDQLSGITGTYTNYSQGLFEMVPDDTTFGTAVSGTAVEPEQVQIEDIAVDQVSQYIILKGVSVIESTDDTGAAIANTYTMEDGSGSITLYNQFNNANYYDVVEVITKESKTLTVEGFISVRYGVAQIVPIKVSDPSGIESAVTDNSNAPAEYYNLQGVKVNNPENGLYIVKRGNKVTKQYICK